MYSIGLCAEIVLLFNLLISVPIQRYRLSANAAVAVTTVDAATANAVITDCVGDCLCIESELRYFARGSLFRAAKQLS